MTSFQRVHGNGSDTLEQGKHYICHSSISYVCEGGGGGGGGGAGRGCILTLKEPNRTAADDKF